MDQPVVDDVSSRLSGSFGFRTTRIWPLTWRMSSMRVRSAEPAGIVMSPVGHDTFPLKACRAQ